MEDVVDIIFHVWGYKWISDLDSDLERVDLSRGLSYRNAACFL